MTQGSNYAGKPTLCAMLASTENEFPPAFRETGSKARPVVKRGFAVHASH